jgi:hypothetical protein
MKPSNTDALSPIVCTLLLLALTVVFVVPVSAANVTYPHGYYYTLDRGGLQFSMLDGQLQNAMCAPVTSVKCIQVGIYYELKHQTYLMEKQNELLAEQNELLRNITMPKYHCTPADKYNINSPFECVVTS